MYQTTLNLTTHIKLLRLDMCRFIMSIIKVGVIPIQPKKQDNRMSSGGGVGDNRERRGVEQNLKKVEGWVGVAHTGGL